MKLNRLNTLLSGVLAGAYMRALANVGSTNPITFGLKCVLKNSTT